MTNWYFHGTSPDRAHHIRRGGFKVGPLMLPGYDEPFFAGPGNIGYGTYISADWRIALWYGRILIRIKLAPGTRFLAMPAEPDEKILKYLKREFGRDILRCRRLEQVLPRNKRLTLKEHVAVLGYHYREVGRYFWNPGRDLNVKRHKAKRKNVLAMHSLGAELRKFGLHGYGEPRDFNGIVVFEPSRLLYSNRIAAEKEAWRQKVQEGEYDPTSLTSSREVGIRPEALDGVALNG